MTGLAYWVDPVVGLLAVTPTRPVTAGLGRRGRVTLVAEDTVRSEEEPAVAAAVPQPLALRLPTTTVARVARVEHPRSQGHQSLALAAVVLLAIRLVVLAVLAVPAAVALVQVRQTMTAATVQRTRAVVAAAISTALLAPRRAATAGPESLSSLSPRPTLRPSLVA